MGPEPEQGRPAETKGRAEAEIRTYDFLDSLGIKYERADHEAAFTMEACEEIDAVLGIKMCKTCFCATDRKQAFIS